MHILYLYVCSIPYIDIWYPQYELSTTSTFANAYLPQCLPSVMPTLCNICPTCLLHLIMADLTGWPANRTAGPRHHAFCKARILNTKGGKGIGSFGVHRSMTLNPYPSKVYCKATHYKALQVLQYMYIYIYIYVYIYIYIFIPHSNKIARKKSPPPSP